MAAFRVLVDTDVLIDYFNTGRFARLLDEPNARVYYSVVTRKELFAKEGLREAERLAIGAALRQFRVIPVTRGIAARYWVLRARYPSLEREGTLIAATALDKRLPLLTRNWKHFRWIEGLVIFGGV